MKWFKRNKKQAESQSTEKAAPAGQNASVDNQQQVADDTAATIPAAEPAADKPAQDALLEENKAPEKNTAPEEKAEAEKTATEKTEQRTDKQSDSGSLFSRLKRGLAKTSESFSSGLGTLFLGAKEIDEDLLEDIETQMLMADVGIEATDKIVAELTQKVQRKELYDAQALFVSLRAALQDLLAEVEQPLHIPANEHRPFVILMVGVNGAGKTTTIGKLAKRLQAEGKSVMLAAGDTFRAAAVEQLQVWGERNQVPVIAHSSGADSAAVIYEALEAAASRGTDVLIADTAGRLHSQSNLMEELSKIGRVIKKHDPSAPHEVMLVIDASTGQNAIAQARHFQQAVGVSGITVTKLDGTAKGGVVFAISQQLGLPIRFIGVGEQLSDLRPFVAKDFIRALFET